jgi:hypothetical protein
MPAKTEHIGMVDVAGRAGEERHSLAEHVSGDEPVGVLAIYSLDAPGADEQTGILSVLCVW